MVNITMKQIAEDLGVSISAVSLVLNGHANGRIRPELAQRIHEETQRLGYKPNRMARSIRTNRTYILGFISDEIATTPFAGRLILGAQTAAQQLGYTLLVVNTNGDDELEAQEIATLKQYGVDGFLYARMFNQTVQVPESLRKDPLVLLDAREAQSNIPSIVPDEIQIGKDATTRLIDAGCRRIAYIGADGDLDAEQGRMQGYRQVLEKAGLPFDDNLVIHPHIGTQTSQEVQELTERFHPDGFFCFNDARAWSVYMEAAKHGVVVGKQISVVGVDNHQVIAETFTPRLTTIELPHYEMGYWGTQKLVSLIDGADANDAVKHAHTRAALPSLSRRHARIHCALVEKESVAESSADS